ncbi:MAG: AI-2E family transporter [Actinobacteria bacterium]|nr:AI-2E family transporter [Actinomycetota bacterium]
MATEQERADNEMFRRRTLVVAGALLGVVVAIWLAFTLRTLLFMVLVSLFVTVAVEPGVHFLEKRGWRRRPATGVVFGGGLLLAIGFVGALVPLFIEQINQLIEAVPEFVAAVLAFLEDNFGFDLSAVNVDEIGTDLVGSLGSAGGTIVGGVISASASVAGFLIFVTTVGLFSFYMVAELPQLQRTVLSFMPEEQQRRALHIWDVAVENMGGYIYSRLVLAVASATLTTVLLGFLDVPFALSLGVWVGVLSQFVPVVGTYLAAILPVIVSLTFNGPATTLWVIVFFVAYQQIENFVIAPYITKRTMEIHPAVSVGAIIIGGALMGGIGVILALPMTGVIQAIISETRRPHDVILDDTGATPET